MAGRPTSRRQHVFERLDKCRISVLRPPTFDGPLRLQPVARDVFRQPHEAIRLLLHPTTFRPSSRKQASARNVSPNGRGEIVFYNLGKFSQLISDFETIHYHSKPKEKYKSFGNFLEFTRRDAYPEGWQNNQYANPDAVRIMTVHQAKGMQWPVVFIPALSRIASPQSDRAAETPGTLIPAAPSKGKLVSRHPRGRAPTVLRRNDPEPEIPAPDLGADSRQQLFQARQSSGLTFSFRSS